MERLNWKLGKINYLTFPIAVVVIPILLITSIIVTIFTITFKVVVDVLT